MPPAAGAGAEAPEPLTGEFAGGTEPAAGVAEPAAPDMELLPPGAKKEVDAPVET